MIQSSIMSILVCKRQRRLLLWDKGFIDMIIVVCQRLRGLAFGFKHEMDAKQEEQSMIVRFC